MYKRPQPGENDEDIIKLQKEFYENKVSQNIQPAAKFSAVNPHVPPPEVDQNDEPPQLSNTFEEIPSFPNIGNIVENPEQKLQLFEPKFLQKSGFPAAKRRDTSLKSAKGSIFSQQIKKIKVENASTSKPIDIQKALPGESFVLTGEDKDTIHQENVNIISQMTQEEIIEERDRLLATMDPAIVTYLKTRRQKAIKKEAIEKVGVIEEQKRAAENIKMDDIEAISDILTQPKAEKWIHFDRMETSKLAWMKDIDINMEKSIAGYEARFDFNGFLCPFEEKEINEKNRALYHHGEEPNRPGYTLQELFQLSRSNITQQKITALNSIANLLSLESSGIYDGIVDIPIEQIFFVLRFCFDDNSPFVLNAAVKALRNLFYYPIDEASLDSLLGFCIGNVQPTLCSEEDIEDDETVNDQQLAETNLVKCLARTEILTRIKYIINTVKPPIETISYVLEILIRLSRDSMRIAKKVFGDDDLIGCILQHFVPKVYKENLSNLNYGVPMKQAVKLCRILSGRSRDIAEKFVNKYNIMDSIIMYISNQHFSANTIGVQLQTECLHFWAILISYNFTYEHFTLIEPILLQTINFHYNNTDLNTSSYSMQGHFGAIINLLTCVAKQQFSLILPYLQLINLCLEKYIHQFCSLNNFLCGKLIIISSLLQFTSSIIYHKSIVNGEKINYLIKNVLSSEGFQVVTSKIRSGSNILTSHETHKPSKNLISVESSVWNASEHIVPVLQTNSCIPFLNCLSSFIKNTDDKELKLQYLNHNNNLTSNWFTKIESELIMNLLKISYDIHQMLDTSTHYVIAVRCLCIFNSQQKEDIEFLFKNIIFNKNYYPGDILLKNLNIAEQEPFVNECLNYLDQIFETYIEVLGLRNEIKKNNFSIDVKIGNVIPLDWIYSPIIVLYANSQKNEITLSEDKMVFIICNCLRWVFIYETYFSDLSLMINPTDKFCRLACVFLTSDDVFFVPEVHDILEKNLKLFIKSNLDDLDFKKSVHGLSDFQDLYKQLLEQYQGVSYGDNLFSNFILIPLMQRANLQYRKTFWSEYSGITQICRITTENLMCSIKIFLEPSETDISLLKCYRKFILGRAVPDDRVLKIISKYHLDTFVTNKREQKMSQN
nr:RNA polymerase II-associated protein 1 [Onthophagus taurus]